MISDGEGNDGESRDDQSEGSQATNVEEGPGYGVAQHASELPAGMKPDDLVWMAQFVAFVSQVLCYSEQWALLISVGDRAHNLFPAHLLAPLDKKDTSNQPLPLVWSTAEVTCRHGHGWID